MTLQKNMDIGKAVADINRKIDSIRRDSLRSPRPHQVQNLKHRLIGNSIANVKHTDLGEQEFNMLKDPDTGEHYIVVNVGGKVVKFKETT